jgi:hypothetical protein
MADTNQPNKETVPFDSHPDVIAKPPAASPQPRETVRIQLPPRPPSDRSSVGRPDGSPPVPVVSPARAEPEPEPEPVVPASDPVLPEPEKETVPVGIISELKKETARIPLVPEPPSKPLPAVQMKKTQRLVAMPEAAVRRPSVSVAPMEESTAIIVIPMSLCWTLLGVSAIALIIQIWIYFS